MTRSKFLYFFLLVVLMAQSSQAKIYNWDETVQVARQQSLDLQTAELVDQSVEKHEKSIQSGFLPKLSVSLSENQSELKNDSESFTRLYSAQLSLTQNLFSGFADFYKNKAAQASTQISKLNLKLTKSSLSSDLKQTYMSLVYAQKYQKLAKEILTRRQENLRNVQLQFENGRENKGSVLLSESYIEQARLDELSALNLSAVSKETLARSLGLKQYADLEIVDNLPKINLGSMEQTPSFEDIALKAPEVLIAQLNEQVSYANQEALRSNFWPSLDLTGTYGTADRSFFPQQEKWTVGLTLSWSIFDGGQSYYLLQESKLKNESTRLDTRSVLDKTIINLRSSYQDLVEAIQKEKVDLLFKKAAEVRAEIARSKYKNGLISFDDWDLVENDLIQREKSYLTSQKDRVVKEALWEKSQGLGVF